jgi:hypothetical protein
MADRQRLKRRQSQKKRQSNDKETMRQQTTADIMYLQNQIGNQATQRVLLQRDAASPSSFNPLDPAVIRGAASAVIAENEAPVRRWLDEKMDHLRLLSLGQIVAMIRREVPEANRLDNGEIQSLAQSWARDHGFTILTEPVLIPRSSGPSLAIPAAVKSAFSIATDGINIIEHPNGQLNIAVSGATAKLGSGRLKVNWNGSVGFEIPVAGFALGGQLSKDRWELKLSTPGAASLPDPAKLTDVFRTAEESLRAMVAATANLPNLDNPAAVYTAISPHIGPVKEAVKVLQEIASSAAGPRFSAGITAGGPMPGQETDVASPAGSPEGVTIMATVIFRF